MDPVPTDQPNQPTTGVSNYVSLRITASHTSWSSILEKVIGEYDYVCYPHKGKKGDNPHFHIFIPTNEPNKVELFRKRAKSLGLTGNKCIGASYRTNGITNAITYGSREKTAAYVSSDDMRALVDMAPAWVQQDHNIGAYLLKPKGREPNPDHYKLITPRNIMKVTTRYRRDHGIVSKNLEDTLEAMHKDNWRLAECFYRQGIMSCYFDEFTSTANGHDHWTSGKFLFLKRDVFNHSSI